MKDQTWGRYYREGWLAFMAGEEENPYQPNSPEHRWWKKGYEAAAEHADDDGAW